jgi:hypothetical protein
LKRAAGTLLALALASCAAEDRMRSDWELQNAAWLAKQQDDAATIPLPPIPREQDLVEFRVDGAPSFRFFVAADTVSVSPEREGVIRYVLVAKSTDGARNVSYEALSCGAMEYRSYASAQGDVWRRHEVPWRPVAQRRAQRTLMTEFFCPRHVAIASGAEGVAALRSGRHPLVIDPNVPGAGGR